MASVYKIVHAQKYYVKHRWNWTESKNDVFVHKILLFAVEDKSIDLHHLGGSRETLAILSSLFDNNNGPNKGYDFH